jgi:hypothetical protein
MDVYANLARKVFGSLSSLATVSAVPTRKSLNKSVTVSVQLIERRIYLIRGQKVMIDVDLAELYDVPTYRLNEAVKRNRTRFPSDFMFQLNKKEAESLRSQFAISNTSYGSLRPQFATSNTGRWSSLFAVRLYRARCRDVEERTQ